MSSSKALARVLFTGLFIGLFVGLFVATAGCGSSTSLKPDAGSANGGAGAGATCAWPASLDTPDAGAGACRPAHDLLSCGDELCLSNDPTECPGEISATTPPPACHDLCGAQEFAVVCGSVGPGPISDPPAGCHDEQATPAGIVFYCCPCIGDGGRDGGGTETAAVARMPQNHRASDSECRDVAPAGTCAAATEVETQCHTDSQCTSGLNGRCETNGGGPAGCFCASDDCTQDDGCTGGPCACHGSAYMRGGNTCAPGNCQIDSDCGAGGFCSPSLSPTSCYGLAGYYCHTSADQCTDDADCDRSSGAQCMYDAGSQRWRCQQTTVVGCPI